MGRGGGGTGARLPPPRVGAPTAGAGPGRAGRARLGRRRRRGAAGPASIGCTGARGETFPRLHRISSGTVGVNAPGKLMDVTGKAPRALFTAEPPRHPSLSLPYRTVQGHMSPRRGGSGLFACGESTKKRPAFPGRRGDRGSGQGTARRDAPASRIKPLSPPGLCARCRTAPRPSPARLPREAARPPPSAWGCFCPRRLAPSTATATATELPCGGLRRQTAELQRPGEGPGVPGGCVWSIPGAPLL